MAIYILKHSIIFFNLIMGFCHSNFIIIKRCFRHLFFSITVYSISKES
uniref:Uncharacterized protein n=1 Tax=Podoviridae sp. ctZkC8 TaxID=2825259 RepID=A0A8S5UBJ5_9CAUD|nr:MAG TPA: hypothetical protein [Podoviridae sp. ctZkC8]DAI58363.1 MAG TPA: hypothetical protein [Crassvirales sp.]DAN22690.1 MAG TPA_asm: hypothetical protein [Bacteriophage sp.]